MNIENYLGKDVRIPSKSGLVFLASQGEIIFHEILDKKYKNPSGIEVKEVAPTILTPLPPEKEGTLYLVHKEVALLSSGREDLVFPEYNRGEIESLLKP